MLPQRLQQIAKGLLLAGLLLFAGYILSLLVIGLLALAFHGWLGFPADVEVRGLDSAIAMLVIVFAVLLRPAEVHWWRAGHLTDQALAALLAVRAPVIALALMWTTGVDLVGVAAIMVPAIALGLLLYRPALRNAQSRRARELAMRSSSSVVEID